MEEKYIVYLHINKTNNKVYVGITSMAVNNRWREGKGYIKCEIMNRAILKYGWNNFEHIILCKTSKDRAIVHCLKGKTKKAGGYKWKYKYE